MQPEHRKYHYPVKLYRERLALHIHQHTGDNLLPKYGIGLQAVGHHIVYVLDKDNIALQVVEVLYECSMTSGTEQQFAVFGTEGRIVSIGSQAACALRWSPARK